MVAVGEIGLDYHWLDACPKERQQEVFAAQLELAQKLALPVVVHDREAHGDTVEFLRKYRPRGVVHCFSGSWETAREILGLGMYIGLGGVVTFKNARHAVEVAQNIPLDRLLLETDAPYMAPVPHRGKRNDSSLIPLVAEKIGELRGLEAQAVSTGLLDILLPVRDLAALERAEQNEGEVTRLSERYGVVGVHMFCPSTPDAAAHCRNFAPLYAIPEEAATGTSNGALTYYLYRRGLTAAGAENRFVQGEKMGKPSEILSRLTDGGDGVKVQVGGRAVLALRCELL